MRNSIQARLTIAFIGLAIGPLLLVGVVLAWQSFATQRQQALSLQREVAQRVSTQVVAFFQELESELAMAGRFQALQDQDRDQQQAVLAELLSYQNVFEELALLDSQGQEQIRLARVEIFTTADLGDRSAAAEFTIPKTSGETYYSPV
jgi:hypothetical protein